MKSPPVWKGGADQTSGPVIDPLRFTPLKRISSSMALKGHKRPEHSIVHTDRGGLTVQRFTLCCQNGIK